MDVIHERKACLWLNGLIVVQKENKGGKGGNETSNNLSAYNRDIAKKKKERNNAF